MKKPILLWIFIAVCTTFLMAADIDTEVKSAVNGLASRLSSPIEISVGEFYLEGTTSTSGLSRIIANRINAYAPNTGRFMVVPLSRGAQRVTAGGAQKGIIQGTFLQIGETVHITLQLVEDPGGRIISTQDIQISAADLKELGVEILPANYKTKEDVKEAIDLFVPPPAPPSQIDNPPANAQALKIEAWPNSDTGTYRVGDIMTINILANKDCYVRVDYIDAAGKWQLFFPNQYNPDNFLRANMVHSVPKAPIEIIIEPPFGMERVWVRASTEPFENIEREFSVVKYATRETVNEARGTRGAGMQLRPSGTNREDAETFFSITTLDNNYNDYSYSYRNPSSVREAIQTMRAEVLRQGGTYDGNESGGSYTLPGVQGRFWASGDTVMVTMRYTGSQLVTPPTRGSGSSYNFTIPKPANIAQAVQSVKSGVEGKGGTFSGNEQQGSFSASGITGRYQVSDLVNVSITDKPFIIPNSLIEKEVKNYFSGK